MSPDLRPAALPDRDGVLNADAGYVIRTEQFVWYPVRALNESGFLTLVVTMALHA